MAKVSLGWRIFIAIELVAVFSWAAWGFIAMSIVGKYLWVAQFLLLMPGNLTGAPAVENLLWLHASLTTIGIAELVSSIAVNALVWLLLLATARRVRLALTGGSTRRPVKPAAR